MDNNQNAELKQTDAKADKKLAKEEKAKQKAEAKAAKSQGKEPGKSKKGPVIILVCLVIAVICFVAFMMIERNMLENYTKNEVVIAKTDIDVGLDITESNVNSYFTVVEIPADIKPRNAYTNVEELVGLFVGTDMESNMIAVPELFNDIDLTVSNPVETSFSISDMSQAVAGTLRRGDEITISAAGASSSRYNGVILDHVMIKAAYASDGTELGIGDAGYATMFVVILSQEDEQTLNELLVNSVEIRIAKINNVSY